MRSTRVPAGHHAARPAPSPGLLPCSATPTSRPQATSHTRARCSRASVLWRWRTRCTWWTGTCSAGGEQGGGPGPPLLRCLHLFSGCMVRPTSIGITTSAECIWDKGRNGACAGWVQWRDGKWCGGHCAGFPSPSRMTHCAPVCRCTYGIRYHPAYHGMACRGSGVRSASAYTLPPVRPPCTAPLLRPSGCASGRRRPADSTAGRRSCRT